MHVAVETGNLEMVQFLLENGASLQGQDYLKNTPLQIAVKNPVINIVKELLKSTKAINDSNALDETPLHTAVSRRLLSMVVEERDSSEYPLEVLRILILKGAKATPIHAYKSHYPLTVALNLYDEEDPLWLYAHSH